MKIKLTSKIFLFAIGFCSLHESIIGQSDIRSYVMFSGPRGTGTSLIGSSIVVNNGSVGAYKLVQTTGNATINSNIYSGDKIIITNSNILKGDLAAAAKTNYPSNSLISTGTILSVGSSTSITGNSYINGNVVIGGGTVNGSVTIPVGKTYIGPIPSGDTIFATPPDLILPTMPADTTIPTLPLNPAIGGGDITGNKTLTPNFRYGNIVYSGNKTLTLSEPGVYVINSFRWSGNSNTISFNFPSSSPGSYFIYVVGNADFGKSSSTISSLGSASKIYFEVHGNGVGTSVPNNSFIVANGSSGGGSKWLGTVYTTNGGISIGSGTGSSKLTGALWSVSSISIQSGVTLDYAPLITCNPPSANAGPDKPLDFSPTTVLTGSSNTSNAKFNWQAVPGTGSLTPKSTDAAVTSVTVSGSYVLKVSSPTNESCFSTDTVVIFSRCTGGITEKSVIGCELKSIYDNHTTTSPFFVITNDSVMIDVIVFKGKRSDVATLLWNNTTLYGLRDTITNDTSSFIITGKYPINHLPNLDSLAIQQPTLINYCRPYYQALNFLDYTGTNDLNSPINSSGIVISAGDTSIRSYLVRKGYSNKGDPLNGKDIKIGILSNSYNTKSVSTPLPLRTNTTDIDIKNDDLPGDTTLRIGAQLIAAKNPNGFTKNVHVIKDYPGSKSDEGRAMAQILHDVAPGAELYFYTGAITAADFAHGILKLDTLGCDIIVDDETYMTEPFFGNGIVAKAVETVKAHGRSYFTSAGNFGGKSYEAPYDSVAAPIGFARGKTAHRFGTIGGSSDIYQSVTLAAGDYTFVLQWVDKFYSIGQGTTTNDLDLYLTTNTDGTGLFGFNRNNIDGDPVEFCSFSVARDTTVNVLIVNNTLNSKPDKIKLVVFRGNIIFNEYSTIGNSTIVGHAISPGAITVGATRFDKAFPFPGPLVSESYSSRGTKVSNINKPDISAPDGVNTTVNMGSVANGGSDYDHDSYSNFFGTSAAAPHAAGMAALLMQGRKKFLDLPTSPDEMRALMKSTATDMEIPGFDSVSGSGFINADAAMRTIAAPTPFEIRLVYPADKIPGVDQFTLTILGQNFSPNTEIRLVNSPGDTTLLTTTFISSTELSVTIDPFQGNPQIIAYTLPYPLTRIVNGEHLDGGFSNTLRFFDTTIIVQAVSFSKKYWEAMPTVFDTIIKIVKPNGDTVLLQNTTLSAAETGLTRSGFQLFTTPATKTSNVGTYNLVLNKLDPNNSTDAAFLKRFNYKLINGTISVDPLPITIAAQNSSTYEGEQIPNTQFVYHLDGTFNIPDSTSLLNSIGTTHQAQLAKDTQGNDILGLVNGQAVVIDNGVAVQIDNGVAVQIDNGVAVVIDNGVEFPIVNPQALTIQNGFVTAVKEIKLDTTQIKNLNFSTTTPSLQNARGVPYLILTNGTYSTGTMKVIDLTQESILDFNQNAAQTTMLKSLTATDKKGLVDIQSYTNGVAVVIDNGVAVQIDNGVAVQIDNGVAVVIDNGVAVQIDNATEIIVQGGQAYIVTNTHDTIPVRNSNNRSAVIVDTTEVGDGLSQLQALNVITGLSAGKQFLIPGSLNNNNGNYKIKYTAGIVTINDSRCLLTHSPFKNFGNTTQNPTSLWLNVVTKVSGQLTAPGDYLLFTGGSTNFNFISSTPSVSNFPIPDGKIIAVTPRNGVTYPRTYFHFQSNTWITEVPFNYSSTSDLFVSGAIINSSTGFQKLNGNTNSVVVGKFYTNKTFSDQWAYAIAAYQLPQTPAGTPYVPPYEYVTYQMIGDTTDVALLKGIVSTNGTYRAATPLPILNYLVQGASGGGGNNYTGSKGSYDNFTACQVGSIITANSQSSNVYTETNTPGSSAKSYMQLIPNPASTYITLSFVPEKSGDSKVVLYTFDGRKVFETNFGKTDATVRYQKTIDVSKLVNGVYLLQLSNEGKITTSKIIISR